MISVAASSLMRYYRVRPTFKAVISGNGSSKVGGRKEIVDNAEAMVAYGAGTKQFANSHIPLAAFIRSMEKSGVALG